MIIEKRKEEAERLLLEAEKKEEEQRAIQARLNEAAEEERRRAERCVLGFLFLVVFSGMKWPAASHPGLPLPGRRGQWSQRRALRASIARVWRTSQLLHHHAYFC